MPERSSSTRRMMAGSCLRCRCPSRWSANRCKSATSMAASKSGRRPTRPRPRSRLGARHARLRRPAPRRTAPPQILRHSRPHAARPTRRRPCRARQKHQGHPPRPHRPPAHRPTRRPDRLPATAGRRAAAGHLRPPRRRAVDQVHVERLARRPVAARRPRRADKHPAAVRPAAQLREPAARRRPDRARRRQAARPQRQHDPCASTGT